VAAALLLRSSKMNKMDSLKTYQSRGYSLIGTLLAITLLLTISGPALPQAPQVSYSFAKLETLGDKTPSGFYHINDFEPGGLNNRGDSIYATDLGTSSDPKTNFGEGAFLRLAGQESEFELALAGGDAKVGDGKTFFGILSPAAINDRGDGAFAFTLTPLMSPNGVNAALYRYTLNEPKMTPVVEPVVVPFKTPAPGGDCSSPAGYCFQGVAFETWLNNRGDLVFSGIVNTDKGVHLPGEKYIGLGVGVFKADARGNITSIVSPGDRAPGGGFFDYAGDSGAGGASINNAGDVALIAHVAGEESKFPNPPFPEQAQLISALGSLYVKDASHGNIISIAHAGDNAPGGGSFHEIISPVINDSGDIAFVGDITPCPPHTSPCPINNPLAVYFNSGHTTRAVALPGDLMPGGGKFVTTGFGTYVNNAGDVAFAAALDRNGVVESGLYVWSHGSVRLVARTGTVIPGIGTIGQLSTGVMIIPPPPAGTFFPGGGPINNRGQILFGATLSDGKTGVLLLATPHD
jgi:hypothetical protein